MTVAVFPTLPGVAYPVLKTPIWETDVQRSVSGKRTTLGHFTYPAYRFELIFNFLRSADAFKEWQNLIAFFNTVGGRRDLFEFNDPSDDTATTQGFGIGDGTTTEFQLVRAITGTSSSWVDPVFAATITNIFDDGSPVDPGDYTVGSTKLITFDTAPIATHVLTWTGTYNWLCRFDEDSATFEQFAYQFWELKKISFTSEQF